MDAAKAEKMETTVPPYLSAWVHEQREANGLSVAAFLRMLIVKARRAASEEASS